MSEAFVCQKCGAALNVPADPSAISARCTYCATDTMLPAEMIAARRPHEVSHQAPVVYYQPITPVTPITPFVQETTRRASSMALIITLISVLLPLVMTGGILWFVHNTLKHAGVVGHHR